ncbi:hypothetical protein C7H19_00675 [Aphanothece hegewaldii CCALA 016]|uniref:Right handed beta helix domain-containing protein n=1 Tax=Aphanothece hegewaldii CCALA 016 TaxID=2107694 RepID=A0A2T1M3C9_9CHRO|nr:choice-of-anchor Q domain-containing protein [Aphanothece hegewaldii]PSF39335.1 hypothetical protein C7H19_00675 [Aphanothece hegewaldii CCALA 016]
MINQGGNDQMLLLDDSSTILYNETNFLTESVNKNQENDLDTNSVQNVPTVGQTIEFTPAQIPNVEVLALATSAPITLQGSPIIYVRQGAGGSGTSWADAYGDLQTAINNASFGSEIWVAAGVYVPTGTGDRAASFSLKDGIEIYGGFGGFETDFSQRNIAGNVTYLSGDIGVVGNNSDNSYHVVTAINIPNKAVLDGFTITGGNANQQNFNDDGGGIFSRTGRTTYSNLIITGNRANDRGGGVYTDNTQDQFNNVVILANQAGQGGGIFIDDMVTSDGTSNSTISLTNSILSQNSASVIGGGIRAFRTTLTLFGTVFDRNASISDGGGISFSATNVNATNSTFSNNTSQNKDGAINVISGSLTATNSIFWGNQAPTNSQFATTRPELITNSIVQGGLAGSASVFNIDPLFVDAANGNLSLQAGSPAINIGNNAAVPTNVVNDVAGLPRIFGGFVDLGAYEFFAFDPASYAASNPNDLIRYYIDSGYSLAALTNHYLQYGRFEGRLTDTFDEFRYIASSYPGGDLIGAFGNKPIAGAIDSAGATLHYINHGWSEGRSTTSFDPARYINSWSDLVNAPFIGTNTLAGTQHFITNGFAEGRDPNLFDAARYIASSYTIGGDLIKAFHYDLEAGSNHYLKFGRNENRSLTDFNPAAYLANPSNADIAANPYFGTLTGATQHYIQFGFAEGRSVA